MSTEYLLGGSPTSGVPAVTSFSADDGWHTMTNAEPTPMPSSRPLSSGIGADSKTIYLVFLAVLVLIVILAILLTIRRYRLRRRYWTATQLALSRGEPLPPARWGDDDPWGLLFPRPERWQGRRKERRWMRVPTLWDAVDTDGEIWEATGQPLSLQSRLPPPPKPEPVLPAPVPPPQGLHAVGDAIRRGWRGAEPPPPPPPKRKEPKESERPLEAEEPVRIAVLIQMPVDPSAPAPLYDDAEDEVAWRPGMELGVWEGNLAGSTAGLRAHEAEHVWAYPPAGYGVGGLESEPHAQAGRAPAASGPGPYESQGYATPAGPPPGLYSGHGAGTLGGFDDRQVQSYSSPSAGIYGGYGGGGLESEGAMYAPPPGPPPSTYPPPRQN